MRDSRNLFPLILPFAISPLQEGIFWEARSRDSRRDRRLSVRRRRRRGSKPEKEGDPEKYPGHSPLRSVSFSGGESFRAMAFETNKM